MRTPKIPPAKRDRGRAAGRCRVETFPSRFEVEHCRGSADAPEHGARAAERKPPMDARKPIPCPLCGYHAPTMPCPHCRLESTEPSLRSRSKGGLYGVLDGLRALPMGLSMLARTPRTVRWLVPPVAITALVYVLVF